MTRYLSYNALRQYTLADALLERQKNQAAGVNTHDAAQSRSLAIALLNVQKRKAYFAFHYDDIMRVNNVRQAWKIKHPDAPKMRSFYDSSLWESRKLEGPDAVKRLIRQGVEYTSAVCLLIGTHTWSRRWVRYEIARAVIDKRGLLGVHINRLNHHERRLPDIFGVNPLSAMAVGKVQTNVFAAAQYYLFEWGQQGGWFRYQDYGLPVAKPAYLPDPSPGFVTPLSTGTAVYDFIGNYGHANIGAWIDRAAQQVGR
jgi:hypothetical protein